MSYYNNNTLGARNSTGSMSSGQTPFMFGGAYGGNGGNGGGNYSASTTSFGNSSVRDCLYWPASLPAGNNTPREFNFSNNYAQQNGGGAYNGRPQQQQRQAAVANSYPQPKAFIQYQGMGAGGESKATPFQIPCQLGPSGCQMGPLSTPEPLTIKVTAPAGAGQDGKPIQFQIDPSQIMGMATMSTPRRR